MPFIASKVEIPEKTKKILEKIAISRTKPANQIQRAKIILQSSAGKNNNEIGKSVGISQDAVSKWRCRFIKETEYLKKIEENQPEELEEAIEHFLKDQPRPGCPPDFTEEQILKILEMACRNPADYGYETSHWSTTQLAKAVMSEGIVESISPASVNRFLKYGRNTSAQSTLLAPLNRKS